MSYEATYDDLRKDVAFLRGWGRDTTAWSTEKTETIEAVIKSAMQRFLFGSLIPGSPKAYDWSFLRQTAYLTTADGQKAYDLPSDFGTAEGWVYFAGTNTTRRPVPIVNPALVDSQQSQYPNATGYPQLAAIRAKKSHANAPQEWELVLFPSPDATYSLSLPYKIVATSVSETAQSLPGGALYARAIKYACLAEAARTLDDSAAYEQDYQSALAAAIDLDAQHRGTNLGYNGDPSTGDLSVGAERSYYVTVNGTQY